MSAPLLVAKCNIIYAGGGGALVAEDRDTITARRDRALAAGEHALMSLTGVGATGAEYSLDIAPGAIVAIQQL